MNAFLESTEHLSCWERAQVEALAASIELIAHDLDEARTLAKSRLPAGWLVYRGGRHVAVHRRGGDERRVLLVVE